MEGGTEGGMGREGAGERGGEWARGRGGGKK